MKKILQYTLFISVFATTIFSCQKQSDHFFHQIKGTWYIHSLYDKINGTTMIATQADKEFGEVIFYNLDTETNRGKFGYYDLLAPEPFFTFEEFIYKSSSSEIEIDSSTVTNSIAVEGQLLKISSQYSNIIVIYSREN